MWNENYETWLHNKSLNVLKSTTNYVSISRDSSYWSGVRQVSFLSFILLFIYLFNSILSNNFYDNK